MEKIKVKPNQSITIIVGIKEMVAKWSLQKKISDAHYLE